MKYLLLIHDNPADYPTPGLPEHAELEAAYWAFEDEVIAAEVHLDSKALQPPAASSVVRVRDGETLISDGPFAETKEYISGYFLIDVDSLEEAQRWAAKIPGAKYGAVEIRPVLVFESRP